MFFIGLGVGIVVGIGGLLGYCFLYTHIQKKKLLKEQNKIKRK